MQTDNQLFLDLLGAQSTRFVIPPYQRMYAWRERQCRELWLDLHRAARGETPHFIGTLLYTSDDVQGLRRLAVVDGQQRLTTMTLLLVALTRHMDAHNVAFPDASAQDIRDAYLLTEADGTRAGKLVLSRNDRDTLLAITEGRALPADPSAIVLENLAYFEGRMQEPDFDPAALWRGINLLFLIVAEATEADNAQLIFESLNSKGMPLTTADLVRNYLLLAESHEEQTRLYDQYWDAIQGVFQPDPGSLRLDNGIQGWLTVRFRKLRAMRADEVYGVFKQYVEDEYTGTTENLLRELRNFCMVWAENYRYHAVKKYKSATNWAVNGANTLVANEPVKKGANEAFVAQYRKNLEELDASL